MDQIFNQIFQLPFKESIDTLKNNGKSITQELSKVFHQQRFRSKETGVSRRDISVWKREGLLLQNEMNEMAWGQYSLIECIWLRMVAKLKRFGIEKELIIELKEKFFNQKAKDFRTEMANYKYYPCVPEPVMDFYKELNTKLETVTDEELEKMLKENNYSLFGSWVMATCLSQMKFAILMDEDGLLGFVNIGKPLNEAHEINVASVLKELNDRSFILINLNELCSSFFENERLIIDNDYYFSIMNGGERNVIEEIRTGKYKQITVNISDGSVTHIKTTNNDKENQEMIRKLSRLLKKGQYTNIELTTKDGVIVKYTQTEMVKMNIKN